MLRTLKQTTGHFMGSSSKKPLVGVISDVKVISPHPFYIAGDKYLRALVEAADVVPIMIPALNDIMDITHWTEHLDGVFLTGAYSMVNPSLYGESKIDADFDYDDQRDNLSRALIQNMLKEDKPLFAVCRGLQDINVALGGSLHQSLHEVEGMNDHREDKNAPLAEQYADTHSVTLNEDGIMRKITGRNDILVNSLHTQGIKELGQGLQVEAVAEDGLIEAFSIPQLTFGLALQWHPEWQVTQNPIQHKLYEAFGAACKTRQQR